MMTISGHPLKEITFQASLPQTQEVMITDLLLHFWRTIELWLYGGAINTIRRYSTPSGMGNGVMQSL